MILFNQNIDNIYIILGFIALLPVIDMLSLILNNYLNTKFISKILTKINNEYKIFYLSSIIYFILICLILYKIIKSNTLTNNKKIIYTILLFVFVYINFIYIVRLFNMILDIYTNNPPMNIDKKYFPNHIKFEDKNNFKILQKEIYDIINNNGIKCFDEVLPIVTNLMIKKNNNCWRFKYLKRDGIMDKNLNKYPLLNKLLSDEIIFDATISLLDPQVSIPEHRGYFKGVLRYHLCIETPDDDPLKPYIIVGGEKYTWKTGEGILFDDMFKHQVVNKSDKRRIVLFIDVIRTDIPIFLQKINNLILHIIGNNPISQSYLNHQHKQDKLN